MIPKLSAVSAEGSLPTLPNSSRDAAVRTDLLLQRMVDACASNLAVLDELGNILFASRAWQLSSEHDAQSAKLNEQGITDPEYFKGAVQVFPMTDALAEDIQRLLNNRQREFHRECSYTGAYGEKWFMVHAARLNLPESGGFRILITRDDVTRRRQAEEELRNLGGRLITAQEQERSRIAGELHDDLNQRMAILAIEIDRLRSRVPDAQSDLIESLEQLSFRVEEISADIHRLSYRLHPSKLDHLDLAVALNGLCEELSQHGKIEIHFEQQGFPAVVPKEITLCVFRIAQETLRNAIKHSGARSAQVRLKKTSQAIHLQVSDNGCGFDPESPDRKNGLGFISMRERLRLVDGNIFVLSQPSLGTQIDVLVPTREHVSAQK